MNTVDRVDELIEKYNLSLSKLCSLSDVPYITLQNARKRGNQLSVDTIDKICQGLGISMSEFFSEDTEASNN